MRRTFTYCISLVVILFSGLTSIKGQDTIPIPLKIKAGIEALGPASYFANRKVLSEEALVAIDLDEKRTAFLSVGYLNYKYDQNNYQYLNKGSFLRLGMDFNLLKPDKSQGKYFAGIGLRYGISRFIAETPFLEKTNYWGETITSLPAKTYWGHFLEVSPGVRSEIFKNFTLGWSVNIRMLLYSGTGKDLRPINFPGFGDASKTFSTSMSYYVIINIPYKKIKAIMKKEAPEETDETNDNNTTNSSNSINSTNSTNSTIRKNSLRQ